VRGEAIAILAAVAVLEAGSSHAGRAAGSRCQSAPPRAPPGLPAPVIVATSCGRFRVGLAGGVVYPGPRTLPVPRGTSYRVARGEPAAIASPFQSTRSRRLRVRPAMAPGSKDGTVGRPRWADRPIEASARFTDPEAFIRLGFDTLRAAALADAAVDLAQAGRLVALGCPPETASRILI
jgi:hypothetical protein